MANEKEKRAEDLDNLEVTEVDDENLEEVSGGAGNTNCGCSLDPH